MEKLDRLVDSGSTGLQAALLRAAARERPGPSHRRRALARLGLLYLAAPASVAAESASAVAAVSGKLVWAKLGKLCLLFALGGAAGVGGGWLVNSTGAEQPQTPAIAHPPPVQAPEPPTPSLALAAAEPVPEAADKQLPAEPAPAVARAARPATVRREAPARPKGAVSIHREVMLLDRARQALHAGEPTRALQALNAYASRYPNGTLREEAAVIRIEALRAQGQHRAAVAAARSFQRAFPSSAHASRVRRVKTTTGDD